MPSKAFHPDSLTFPFVVMGVKNQVTLVHLCSTDLSLTHSFSGSLTAEVVAFPFSPCLWLALVTLKDWQRGAYIHLEGFVHVPIIYLFISQILLSISFLLLLLPLFLVIVCVLVTGDVIVKRTGKILALMELPF